MVNFSQKSRSDCRRNSACDTIKLQQFAQHDEKIKYFSGKNYIVWFKLLFSIIVVESLKMPFPSIENCGCVLIATYIRYFKYTTRLLFIYFFYLKIPEENKGGSCVDLRAKGIFQFGRRHSSKIISVKTYIK